MVIIVVKPTMSAERPTIENAVGAISSNRLMGGSRISNETISATGVEDTELIKLESSGGQNPFDLLELRNQLLMFEKGF